MTQTTDLNAIVDALRRHDRFLVVTHENPDGDALGSLLAAALALRQLGKDVVMYLAGDLPLPREYAFMPVEGLVREPPADAAGRESARDHFLAEPDVASADLLADGTIELGFRGDDAAAAGLLARAVLAGFQIVTFSRAASDLEELFLQVTARDGDVPASATPAA